MRSSQRELAEGILYTDQYQLTMAQLYFRMGLHDTPAQFDHFFRGYPDYGDHQAGYCVNAGLEWLLDWMGTAHFGSDELEALRGQTGSEGTRMFGDDFLEWLAGRGNFESVTLRAIPEGRVVHPNVPITVVEGPLAVAQLLETALLNHLNFQTLIATKASRVAESGRGRPVLEFGLRRAPERGSSAAARAALIGGAAFTSAVGISHVLGYPPKGTHAHSMVQVFMAMGDGELGAFRAYAEVYPDDCLLLVDTIDTLESGIPNAIKVFEELRARGHRPVGVRLDSGDLAYLSIQSALMLDRAGFPDTAIVLSGQLDELAIWQILAQIEQEAPRYGVEAGGVIGRLVYGVGSRLATSHGAPSLDGVYKVVAVRDGGEWLPAMKISDSPEKVANPGQKRVWRVYDDRGRASADVLALADEDLDRGDHLVLHHPSRYGTSRVVDRARISKVEAMLEEVLVEGVLVVELPDLEEMRRRRAHDLEALDQGVRRLLNPHIYHVSLTEPLWRLKQELIRRAGGEG
ncbi:MAG: nicotinate phosphoribosyltransferase [Acidimicrobiia bacterium]